MISMKAITMFSFSSSSTTLSPCRRSLCNPFLHLMLLFVFTTTCLSPIIGKIQVAAAETTTIIVGETSNDFDRNVGWTDGVCYGPINDVIAGDELLFEYPGIHDVYKMSSKQHFLDCNFTDGTLVGEPGDSPFTYTVTSDDYTINDDDDDEEENSIYFACSIGTHCSDGTQKLVVNLKNTKDEDEVEATREQPTSNYYLQLSLDYCAAIHDGTVSDDGDEDSEGNDDSSKRSVCTKPILDDDGRYYTSCLSGPTTLTPGGVVNNLNFLHYPFPTDRRVLVGERTWEFVSGDPIVVTDEESSEEEESNIVEMNGVEPVPVNQLYVHHLSGSVVLGQGTEGVRRTDTDAPFPYPYGSITGDEGDMMGFHIIDLREVSDDNWLACIECRCSDGDGTYLDTYPGNSTGGVSCCSNCTSLEGPTVDYRMRYNVSWSDVHEDRPIVPLLMLTADISPAVNKNIEYDVPQYTYLEQEHTNPDDPIIQRLERVAPFNELFHHGFFGELYHGPSDVKLLRCVGHLHVAAIRMWIINNDTDEVLCDGVGGYGTDPSQDEGFLTTISVTNYGGLDEEDIITFPSDQVVKFITEYNASEVHTGVMGMEFIFVSSEESVKPEDMKYTVTPCIEDTCDPSLLPPMPDEMVSMKAEGGSTKIEDNTDDEDDVCVDTIEDSMGCKFGNLCSCEEFVNAPESTGCNGTYTSDWGNIEINSICRKYCDCPPLPSSQGNGGGGGGNSGNCDDILKDHPACKFGGMCDCDTFVNAAESTGCGGIYKSDMGNINVNELCPSYCDACPDVTLEEELSTMYVEEILETDLKQHCHYSTSMCKRKLSNIVTCGRQISGYESLDPIVQLAVTNDGERIVQQYSKLGSSNIHAGNQEEEIQVYKSCTPGQIQLTGEDIPPRTNDAIEAWIDEQEEQNDDESSSSSSLSYLTITGTQQQQKSLQLLLLLLVSVVCTTTTIFLW